MFQLCPHVVRCQGATLLEIVMATLITGLMMVATLDGVGSVFQTHQHNADRLLAPGLAHELMAEVLSMPYKDPDGNSSGLGTDAGESGTSRADFDDVDDYHGLNTLGARAKNGTSQVGYTGWRQQVSVSWIEVLTGLPWILGDTGLKRITVTITSPEGDITQLVAYRFEEGTLEQAPALDTEAVTWLGAELRIGSGSTARMGTNLPNYTVDSN